MTPPLCPVCGHTLSAHRAEADESGPRLCRALTCACALSVEEATLIERNETLDKKPTPYVDNNGLDPSAAGAFALFATMVGSAIAGVFPWANLASGAVFFVVAFELTLWINRRSK